MNISQGVGGWNAEERESRILSSQDMVVDVTHRRSQLQRDHVLRRGALDAGENALRLQSKMRTLSI